MRYFANLTIKGTVRPDQVWYAIGVQAVPMGTPGFYPTIGVAFDAGRTAEGFKLFRLAMKDGAEPPGRWLLVDGEFRPAPQ